MIDFDNYRVEDLTKLTAEEESRPYAEYYYRGRLTPPAELLAAIAPGHQLDPAQAVRLDNLASLLNPDCPEPKSGYCQLPGGGAYACTVIKMPGVDMNMVRWWIPWVLGDHLRYKIWHPGSHLEHYDGLAVEDVGGGMADIFLGDAYTDAELGFPGKACDINPVILAVNSCKGRIRLHSDPPDSPKGRFSMVHMVRAIEGGIEYWSFAWCGLWLENGQAVNVIAPDEIVTAENGRHFASHLAHEYTTFAKILPELYAQYGQDPITPPMAWPVRVKGER